MPHTRERSAIAGKAELRHAPDGESWNVAGSRWTVSISTAQWKFALMLFIALTNKQMNPGISLEQNIYRVNPCSWSCGQGN